MWVLPKMVSFQMWKHHRRTSFKKIPSRATIHMHARPTLNIWKYFATSVSEEDRRNKRNKIKVWECKRKTNGDGKDLWWIKIKIPEGNKKLTRVTKRNR